MSEGSGPIGGTAAGAPRPLPPQDEQHLRLLSVFHYVHGVLQLLVGCVPLILIGVGLIVAIAGGARDEEPRIVGGIMTLIGGFVLTLVLVKGVASLATGYFLAARRHLTFCTIVAAFDLLAVPFGTALGIFTLVVLSRTSVRRLFGETW